MNFVDPDKIISVETDSWWGRGKGRVDTNVGGALI